MKELRYQVFQDVEEIPRVQQGRTKKVQEGNNLLQRDFTATEPNHIWCVDISYIPTKQGWLYLAVVIDHVVLLDMS